MCVPTMMTGEPGARAWAEGGRGEIESGGKERVSYHTEGGGLKSPLASISPRNLYSFILKTLQLV